MTSANTAGKSPSQRLCLVPITQLVTPITTAVSSLELFGTIKGPPESPEHGDFLVSLSITQIIPSVIPLTPYKSLQLSLVNTVNVPN